MLNLTKPNYVMPVHGDHQRLRLHAELAESVGIDAERIFQGRNGVAARDRRATAPSSARTIGGGDDLRRRRRHRRPRRRRPARPPDALGRRRSSSSSQLSPPRTAISCRRRRSSSAACRSSRTTRRRACSRSSATSSWSSLEAANKDGVTEPVMPSAGPSRRHRVVRLRPAAPPPDGPAGGRRGLRPPPRLALATALAAALRRRGLRGARRRRRRRSRPARAGRRGAERARRPPGRSTRPARRHDRALPPVLGGLPVIGAEAVVADPASGPAELVNDTTVSGLGDPGPVTRLEAEAIAIAERAAGVVRRRAPAQRRARRRPATGSAVWDVVVPSSEPLGDFAVRVGAADGEPGRVPRPPPPRDRRRRRSSSRTRSSRTVARPASPTTRTRTRPC